MFLSPGVMGRVMWEAGPEGGWRWWGLVDGVGFAEGTEESAEAATAALELFFASNSRSGEEE